MNEINKTKARLGPLLIAAFVALYALLVFGCIAAEERLQIFDDSFITYRYAKNLANGYGITWNPGEPPVEGYTNFLLVVLLAPAIRIGLDPLWTVRILSFLAAVSISLLIALSGRRIFKSSWPAAIWMGSILLFFPQTARISMLGLETVLYALFLFLTFFSILQFSLSNNRKFAMLFGVSATFSLWLRPEAIILISICVCVMLARREIRRSREFGLIFLVFFLLPVCLQVLWKYIHFGSIIPNPFYIKVAGSRIFSPRGMNSVFSFAKAIPELWLLLLLSIPTMKRHSSAFVITIIAFLSYFLFFSHVDTLMDAHGRFLFPLLPFILFASSPALLHWFDALAESKVPIAATFCVVLISSYIITGMQQHSFFLPLKMPKGIDARFEPDNLMYKEYIFARRLAEYPGIRETKIACGDAGVMPYFTGAKHLDTVGLNNRFFATHQDPGELIDRFFQEQPDLAFISTTWNKKGEMIVFPRGHGPLGGLKKIIWAADPRWSGYAYAGTVKTNYYDLNVFVRKSYPRSTELVSFIQNISDCFYDPFPLAIGQPDKNAQEQLLTVTAPWQKKTGAE